MRKPNSFTSEMGSRLVQAILSRRECGPIDLELNFHLGRVQLPVGWKLLQCLLDALSGTDFFWGWRGVDRKIFKIYFFIIFST